MNDDNIRHVNAQVLSAGLVCLLLRLWLVLGRTGTTVAKHRVQSYVAHIHIYIYIGSDAAESNPVATPTSIIMSEGQNSKTGAQLVDEKEKNLEITYLKICWVLFLKSSNKVYTGSVKPQRSRWQIS